VIERVDLVDEGYVVLNSDLVVLDLNDEACNLMGGGDCGALVGKTFWEAGNRPVHPQVDAAIRETLSSRVPQRMKVHSDVTGRWFDLGVYPTDGGNVALAIRNVTDSMLSEAVTSAQKQALEMAISGEPLNGILTFLCGTVEKLVGSDVRMAILLVENDHLTIAAAPQLPPDYCAVIDGMLVAEGVGACGTAAFRGTHVITTDVETDPLWAKYREVALRENLRACWAAPVKGTDQTVIALFAIYYDHAWNPSATDRALVELVSQTSSLIIETHKQVVERKRAEQELRDEVEIIEALNVVASTLSTEMELSKLVQAVTDAAVKVSEGEFGAFFYNVVVDQHEEYMLYALSGAPQEAFARYPMPGNTAIFEPTFRGTGTIRLDDVTKDERYGKNPPYYGMPEGHLPVRSYMAVPVVSHNGTVHGGLFIGHPEAGRFTARHELLVSGLAGQAAVAIDNRRLYTELKDTATQLSTALNAAKLGAWRWDPKSDEVDFSDRACEIFGFEPGVSLTWAEIQTRIHPEDLPVALGRIEASLGGLSQYDVEYRVLSENAITWVSAIGDTQFSENGEPVGMHGIVLDITDRKVLEAELLHRANALQEADRRKDEFLATLAHELRNPLAPIRSGLDLLRIQQDDPQTLKDIRGVLERQVDHMVRLVDDLLDVSRITRGTVTLKHEVAEVSEIVRTAVESAMPGISGKGHVFNLHMPGVPMSMRADPARLAQILSNLLYNAARYTPGGGQIDLYVTEDGPDVSFTVRDTGVGIDPDMQERIFDMFTQVERVGNRSTGGLGIGLTIARRLAELHSGSISARSDGVGLGSEFTVRIPRGLTGVADETSEVRREAGGDSLKIIVADDNEDAVSLMRVMLGRIGHEVHTGHDGAEAIALGREIRPDVMILDIGMPNIDGYETARRIRKEDWGTDITLIALTGWGQPEDRRLTLEAGFNHHLTKPVQIATLQAVLESVRQKTG